MKWCERCYFFSAGLAASKLFVSPRLSHCFASSHLGTVRRQTDSGGTNFVLHSSSADDAVASFSASFWCLGNNINSSSCSNASLILHIYIFISSCWPLTHLVIHGYAQDMQEAASKMICDCMPPLNFSKPTPRYPSTVCDSENSLHAVTKLVMWEIEYFFIRLVTTSIVTIYHQSYSSYTNQPLSRRGMIGSLAGDNEWLDMAWVAHRMWGN